jgi:acetyl-CoA C-acetyltransferase
MSASDPIVIAAFARTPIGSFLGSLSGLPATMLGATAIREAVKRAGVPPETVDQVIMGCVLPAGLGQAPARQAAIGGGLPLGAPATTVNKVCGSGLQAAILGASLIDSGSAEVVVAGGMESMSNAPYLLAKHRTGARIGHDRMADSMYLDGLEDAYDPGRLMGTFAEDAAEAYQLTRAAQDAYALESLTRARSAQTNGAFDREIVSVEVPAKGAPVRVAQDEQPNRVDPSKIPTLKPAFAEGGTVTAANSSSISDGAAAVVLTRASVADRLGLPVAARVVAYGGHAQAPAEFTSAPVPAMEKTLARAGWSPADVDLYEVNEAFAVVPMIAMREMAIPRERLNVNGGACALGHPIGASGARILATLIAALQTRDQRRGVASLCIGGGEAVAMAVERVA